MTFIKKNGKDTNSQSCIESVNECSAIVIPLKENKLHWQIQMTDDFVYIKIKLSVYNHTIW